MTLYQLRNLYIDMLHDDEPDSDSERFNDDVIELQSHLIIDYKVNH